MLKVFMGPTRVPAMGSTHRIFPWTRPDGSAENSGGMSERGVPKMTDVVNEFTSEFLGSLLENTDVKTKQASPMSGPQMGSDQLIQCLEWGQDLRSGCQVCDTVLCLCWASRMKTPGLHGALR